MVDEYSLMNDIDLQDDDLTDETKSIFTYHTNVLRNFQLYRRSILSNDLLTSAGRRLLFFRIDRLFKQSKQVFNYMAAHPEYLNRNLPPIGPLIICGLPRTGSTLLYNLMACDPNCRAPLYSDIFGNPVQPIARSNYIEQQKRNIELQAINRWREQVAGRKMNISQSHAMFPIDEDIMIMQQVGLIIPLSFMTPLHDTDIEDWVYDETNKSFAYDYHDTFLRMLNSCDPPSSHWLLKSPEHSLYLNTLINRYPSSTVIMTHRRLDEVLPSYCRLVWEFSGIHFNENDTVARTTLTIRARRHIDRIIRRILSFRQNEKSSNHPVIDVMYEDLMSKPVDTVRQIYDQLGFSWSNEFETSMIKWLEENPQGKQGRHVYNLSDYDLNRDCIEKRYAEYIDRFLK